MSILISCESGGDRVPSQLVAPRLRLELDHEIRLPTTYRKRKSRKKSSRKPKYQPGSLPPRLRHDEAARYVSRRMAQRLTAPLVGVRVRVGLD